MPVFTPQKLASMQDQIIGPGPWMQITQQQIDAFADATGDRQWIHVDVERAKREAPGGTTIAHGYLLMALLGTLQPALYSVEAKRVLNVGLNRLRFLNPVAAGSFVRLKEVVKSSEEANGGLRVTNEVTLELQGAERPAMVAEIVFLFFT